MTWAFGDSVRRLGSVRVLRCLPVDALATVARSGREVTVPRGQAVFSTGSAAAAHLLLAGRVVLAVQSPRGNGLHLAMILPGELFGELSLFVGRQVGEARAVRASTVAVLRADAVAAALNEHPRAMADLAGLLAERRLAAEARLAELAMHSVGDRLLCLLRRLAHDVAVPDSRGRLIRKRLTHEELACLVGADRVSVTRSLGKLRRSGHVLIAERRLIVTARGAGTDSPGPEDGQRGTVPDTMADAQDFRGVASARPETPAL
jgi:CRP-like cAMP-binding protein